MAEDTMQLLKVSQGPAGTVACLLFWEFIRECVLTWRRLGLLCSRPNQHTITTVWLQHQDWQQQSGMHPIQQSQLTLATAAAAAPANSPHTCGGAPDTPGYSHHFTSPVKLVQQRGSCGAPHTGLLAQLLASACTATNKLAQQAFHKLEYLPRPLSSAVHLCGAVLAQSRQVESSSSSSSG